MNRAALRGAIPNKGTSAMRNTLIAFLLCTAEVGFAQTLLDTTTVHGIGAKSCGEYLSAVSDHAPGTGMTVKQADVDYFDAADRSVRVVSRLYDRHEHGVVRTHHADYGWRCRDG